MVFFNPIYKFTLLILGSLFFSISGFSQNLLLNNIKSVNLINQAVIKDDENVKGYFFIYEIDTLDNDIDTYKFTITDKNLNILKETTINVSEETSIFKSSCTGSEIVLLFFHADKKTLEYQIYDLSGFKKFVYTINLTGKELRQYKKMALVGANNIEMKNFYPIDKVGFIFTEPFKHKDISSLSFNFYGTKNNYQWSYVPLTGGSYFFGEYLGTQKDVVYIYMVSYKGSIYTDKPEAFIVGLDLKTGKELFKKSADGTYKILAKGVKILNDGESYLYGAYYKLTADINKDKSLGFALWEINDEGNIIEEKYISWEKDFNEYLNISTTGNVQGIGYIYFHNIIQTASGDLYLLGEGHQKTFNPLGIIDDILAGPFLGTIYGLNLNFIKQVSTDIILIKLDSFYKIKEVNIYEKKSSDFDEYNATQINNKDSSVSFWFLSKKTDVLKSITLKNNRITIDNIKTNPKATKSVIFPGSNGQNLILDYFQFAKKLELHFEKSN